jgi:hypothetical protein
MLHLLEKLNWVHEPWQNTFSDFVCVVSVQTGQTQGKGRLRTTATTRTNVKPSIATRSAIRSILFSSSTPYQQVIATVDQWVALSQLLTVCLASALFAKTF